MTKIYEALQAAGKERLLFDKKNSVETIRVAAPGELEECLLVVYRRVESMLEQGGSRIIAFVGIPGGEDCRRLVSTLARAVVNRLRKKVLHLTAEATPDNDALISTSRLREIIHGSDKQEGINAATRPLGEPMLVSRRFNAMELVLPLMQDLTQADNPVSDWREHFDLVLLDVPPVEDSPSTEILCSVADGVVLVLTAGRARWEAVQHGMDQILGQQGRVLGVILNRQRHYIPDFLYRRL